MIIEDLFSYYRRTGYDFGQVTYRDGEYELLVGRLDWFTAELCQTVTLPSGKGATLDAALAEMVKNYFYTPSGACARTTSR
jgi:hypothetical protein